MQCPLPMRRRTVFMAVPGLRLFQTGGLPTFPRPFIPSTRCSDGAGAIFLPPAFGASKRRCDAAFRWIFFAGNWPRSRQLAEEQLLLGNGSPVTHHRLVFWLILGRHPASLYQPNPYPNTNTSYPTAASRSAHKFPQAPAIVEVSKILSASAVSLWDELMRFCSTGHILIFTRIAESNQQNLLCQA